jgi:hypothetical protein
VIVLALAVALLAGACSSHKLISLPEPPPVAPTTTTEPFPDFSSAVLARVPGRTTTTIAVGPGPAIIKGTVVGPDGPVGGATVRLERFVGDSKASLDVQTQADGTFVANNLLGGRWRVRAWAAPDRALTTPIVFYMAATDQKQLNLALARYAGTNVTSAVAPVPPIVGDATNLVVAVTSQQVDNQGVVRATPVAGATAELVGSGDWAIKGSSTQTTFGDGTARWQLVCGSPGKQPLSVVVNGTDSFPIDMPACEQPPPETTTTSTVHSTSTTEPTTTTTS